MIRFYIYIHFDKQTGLPFYVGKGKNRRAYEKRRRGEEWKKCSEKGYTIKIVEKNLTEKRAYELEKYYIKKFGRLNNGSGFLINKTDGGEGGCGYVYTDERKKELSIKYSGEGNPNYGKECSEETKQKISKKNKEWHKNNQHPSLGKKRSEESKKLMSIKQLGKGKNIRIINGVKGVKYQIIIKGKSHGCYSTEEEAIMIKNKIINELKK